MEPPLRSHFTPRLRRQPSVLVQSAPVEKFSNLVVPSAIPPSMAYRCEMDLSPGRRTEPESPLAGRITMSLDCMRFLQYSGMAERVLSACTFAVPAKDFCTVDSRCSIAPELAPVASFRRSKAQSNSASLIPPLKNRKNQKEKFE